MESGKDVCAVFLDYRKAFDSVPHAPLMRKLQDMELPTNLLAWISDYLTLRKQQVISGVSRGGAQGARAPPLASEAYN